MASTLAPRLVVALRCSSLPYKLLHLITLCTADRYMYMFKLQLAAAARMAEAPEVLAGRGQA